MISSLFAGLALLVAAASVPWWSVPAVAAAVASLWLFRNNGKSVTEAGLAGPKSRLGSIRRGQSARSVAEMAANAALAMQTQVELQASRITSLEQTIDQQNSTIVLLQKDNERLERLVTQTTWGESLTTKIIENHKETLMAIAAIRAAQ